MENLNLLFYKTFYSKLGDNTWFDERNKVTVFEHDIITKSEKLVDSRFYKEDYKPVCEAVAPHKFMLKTAYPGLLAGTGYAHGVDSDKDIKVGFSFEFVTGQPYIPGSSVKGLLRSCFAHPEVIISFLEEKKLDEKSVKALEKSIFGTQDEASDDGVDIFFDAVIVRGTEQRFDNDKDFGRVMGFDAITPHGEDLTKNPIPIKILKVMPDVVFEFSFSLANSVIGDVTVTAEEKQALFEKLLLTFGIGAKTNVGYGVLEEYKEEELERYVWPDRSAKNIRATVVSKKEFTEKTVGLEINKVYDCIVFSKKKYDDNYVINVTVKDTNIRGIINTSKKEIFDSVADKEIIKAKYYKDSQKGNHLFSFVGKN